MNEYLDIILEFMEEAGVIALNGQKNLKAEEKSDCSIVTQIDLQISKLFREKIDKYLKLDNHEILDEENLPDKNTFFNSKNEFLWTIDPIDGTTTYFYGLPLWAIGISLYKNFKPYIGAIYLPYSKELIYTDGEKSYYVENAFCKDKKEIVITAKECSLIKKSIILAHKLKDHDRLRYTMLDLYSAYVMGFYTVIGKSFGVFFNNPQKLWDITATLPIALNAGYVFRNTENDKDLNILSEADINDNWYLNNTYLLTTKEHYKNIKDILK